jgi:hypothetical protein
VKMVRNAAVVKAVCLLMKVSRFVKFTLSMCGLLRTVEAKDDLEFTIGPRGDQKKKRRFDCFPVGASGPK